MQRTKKPPLSEQIKVKVAKPIKKKAELDGNTNAMISTGSTLLDLAISGGRVRGGGIPSGILVEIFGPSGAGKTVLLCEIAGDIQRKGGDIMFHDPEARLNDQFAMMFDLKMEEADYSTPDTIPEVFTKVRKWEPESKQINGIMADSLAALSTDMEMDNDDGDKMGMRRPKEFSEQLRKTARILAQKNLLMVCSNQVRVNVDAGPYGQKYKSPGGEAVGFYSSLRLRLNTPAKLIKKVKIAGKEKKMSIGVTTVIEVFKSSVWKPHRTAPVTIIFDYGVDDVRENLQYIKTNTSNTKYMVGDRDLGVSMSKAIDIVEEEVLQAQLKEEVINLWEEIESKFTSNRKKKVR